MKHIAAVSDVDELAREVLSARQRPLVLISTLDDGGYAFDPEAVARELGDEATVFTIETGEVTRALERELPEKTHAFGGAARAYPPDFGTDPRWQRSLLRFPARSHVNDLIEDALSQITVVSAQPAAPTRTWTTATVELLSGSSGNVARLDSGDRVMIVADLLPAKATLMSGLRVGSPVAGWLSGRDLAPEPAEVDPSVFAVGDTILARVTKVTDARVTMSVHPAVPEIVLRRRDVIPGADAGENSDLRIVDVVRVGSTARARVTAPAPALALSLVDVAGDEPRAGLPLLRGGPPWLQEGGDAAPEATEANAPGETATAAARPPVDGDVRGGLGGGGGSALSVGIPAAAALSVSSLADIATTADVAALRDEVVELRSTILRLARDLRAGTDLETLDRLRDEASGMSIELSRERALRRERDQMIARLNQELREARSARATAATPSKFTRREDWPTADGWVRHEVATAWAARTTASDKHHHPVAEYIIGPRFADSLDALDDGQFAKAMRTVVDVVTGRAASIPARDLHRLRTGFGGDDPYVERADGAKCWRAAIEQNAPSARRLHYWELPGGRIELSRVVLHDDVEP